LRICHDYRADFIPDVPVSRRNHAANMKKDPRFIPDQRFGLYRTEKATWRALYAEHYFDLGCRFRANDRRAAAFLLWEIISSAADLETVEGIGHATALPSFCCRPHCRPQRHRRDIGDAIRAKRCVLLLLLWYSDPPTRQRYVPQCTPLAPATSQVFLDRDRNIGTPGAALKAEHNMDVRRGHTATKRETVWLQGGIPNSPGDN
jgi:hypothetical protein